MYSLCAQDEIGSNFLNLREQILHYRLKGITPSDDRSYLNSSLSYLERYTSPVKVSSLIHSLSLHLSLGSYFSLVVINSFFASSPDRLTFQAWIKDRTEIWNMFVQLRRHHDKLRAFRPVDDLTTMLTGVEGLSGLQTPALLSGGNESTVIAVFP